jgi:ATP-dependent helicase/DNAse subunit B
VEESFELAIFGEIKKIKLKGYIDRVDEVDGKIRIIDYKTGKVNEKEVSISKAFQKFDGSEIDFLSEQSEKIKHFFQLVTYLYLFKKKTGKTADQNGIISMVNFKNNPFMLNTQEFSNDELIAFYPEILRTILEDIYNPETYFEHKPKALYCDYC